MWVGVPYEITIKDMRNCVLAEVRREDTVDSEAQVERSEQGVDARQPGCELGSHLGL